MWQNYAEGITKMCYTDHNIQKYFDLVVKSVYTFRLMHLSPSISNLLCGSKAACCKQNDATFTDTQMKTTGEGNNEII